MKFFSTIATIALGVTAVAAVAVPDNTENMQKRCLAKDTVCKKDGSLGGCCSNFCLQEAGVSFTCTKMIKRMLTIV